VESAKSVVIQLPRHIQLPMKTILILEDNDERIAGFRAAVAQLGAEYALKVWHDAPSMIRECEAYFPNAVLISLDHDLDPRAGATEDPGDGLAVAEFLAGHVPVCPAIVHTSNTDRAWSMHNELRFAHWFVDRVGPIGNDWIRTLWLPKARELLAAHGNTWPGKLPPDHHERMARALLSLDGLSVGDGFGECFFSKPEVIERRLAQRDPPPPPWFITDDSTMALSIVRCLKRYGRIERDALAAAFASEYASDPNRGYGGTAHEILQAIGEGVPWRLAAGRAFGGEGSCGNGGAMRAAPVGAYFADDPARIVAEARASAEVTHAHADGQSGAIAVALAAAWMVRHAAAKAAPSHDLISFVLEHLPRTDTYHALQKALTVPLESSARGAVWILGNGSQVISSDTVPFCLWIAARHSRDYEEALWATASAAGDVDTTCAIVGGIVALGAGRKSIPAEWLKAREEVKV
jgi:ADP-ribosylglycohydrolase